MGRSRARKLGGGEEEKGINREIVCERERERSVCVVWKRGGGGEDCLKIKTRK